jgi:hypothetical protein
MKKILVAALFALTSQYAQASVFHCTYAEVKPEIAYEFDIDTVTDNNHFINLGDDRSVGCVVLHSTPKLLGCTLAKSKEYQNVATVDENSALLSLDVQQKQYSAKLICLKQK